MRFFIVALLFVLSACGRNDHSSVQQLLRESAVSDFHRNAPRFAAAEVQQDSSTKILLHNIDYQSPRRIEKESDASLVGSLTFAPKEVLQLEAKAAIKKMFPGIETRFTNIQAGEYLAHASFQQIYKGVDVLGATATISLAKNADWKSLTATFINQNLLEGIVPRPSEKMNARRYLPEGFEVSSERSVLYPRKELNEELKIYAAREFKAFSSKELDEIQFWIDENTQELLGVFNPRQDLKSLAVKGSILPEAPDDLPIEKYFPFVRGVLDLHKMISADESGQFGLSSIEAKKLVVYLENDFLKVSNWNKPVGNYEVDLLSSKVNEVDIDAGPSLEERNIYYWVMEARKFLRDRLHYTDLNYQLQAVANYKKQKGDGLPANEDEGNLDNAGFLPDKRILVFGSGRIYFKNMALSASIIIHEFGHAVTEQIYGTPPGYEFASMNEGFSDFFAAQVMENPIIADGATLPAWSDISQKTFLRTVDNSYSYPENFSGTSAHNDSQLFSGALWDLRKSLGSALADSMIQEARLAQAKSISEFLLELLEIEKIASGSDDYRVHSKNNRLIWKAFRKHGLDIDVFFVPKIILQKIKNSDGVF